ncbi:hypothetical protein LPB86_09915 [Pedobacter sp. MC2016-14]|uniref:hypothetical protein n=1 Tax=Pedobacter sp. MC2016-14 TaxID=2897327 RepID=UPI001E3EA84A|nr:hypothetical protein [Pedobacter sp. MC2016-14]MCD0488548.1 hypothetical protein [Pedobacter sp. MC2016-14]
MQKPILFQFLGLLIFCSITNAEAQSSNSIFEMTAPKLKIKNSHYNKFIVLDSRADTSLGIVQVGLLNQMTKVTTSRPLKQQIEDTFTALTDSSASSGTLVFQLRQLNFTEVTKTASETGYCQIRANLYQMTEGRYLELEKLDTLISFNAMDVTRRLFKKGNEVITKYIAQNLSRALPNNTLLSYEDILQVDSIEKSKIILYTSLPLKDGFYKNYHSFKNQKPDYTNVTCITDQSTINIKSILDENGKAAMINEKFAAVYQGKPYIITEKGILPLQKEGDLFYFTGLSKVGNNTGAMLATSALFGLVGALVVNDFAKYEFFDIKVDHLNGSFVPFRQADKEKFSRQGKYGKMPSRVFKEDDMY